MKPGQVVERFAIKGKDGKKLEVLFRFPKMGDAKEAMSFINELRDEAEFLGRRRHETLASEKHFLAKWLKHMRQRNGLLLFVEVDGRIVGDANIEPTNYESCEHIGKFAIALRERFTGLGIGSRLMKRMLQLARTKTKFRIIGSSYFSKNPRSRKLHEKFGFREWGVLPKGAKLKDGSYCDHIYLYKIIKKL